MNAAMSRYALAALALIVAGCLAQAPDEAQLLAELDAALQQDDTSGQVDGDGSTDVTGDVGADVLPTESCAGSGGGKSTDGCWCDAECLKRPGDCCPDRIAQCQSCSGNCGKQAPLGC